MNWPNILATFGNITGSFSLDIICIGIEKGIFTIEEAYNEIKNEPFILFPVSSLEDLQRVYAKYLRDSEDLPLYKDTMIKELKLENLLPEQV